mgnify:CR=1 FL=1
MYYFNILKSKYPPHKSKEVKEAQQKEREAHVEGVYNKKVFSSAAPKPLEGEYTIADAAGHDTRKRPVAITDANIEDFINPRILSKNRHQIVPVSMRDDSGRWLIDEYLGNKFDDNYIVAKLKEYPFHTYSETKVQVGYETPLSIPDEIEKVVIEYLKKGTHFDNVWINKDGGTLSGAQLDKVKARIEPSVPDKPSKWDKDPNTGDPIVDEDILQERRQQGKNEFDKDEDKWFQQLERGPNENEAMRYDWTLHSVIMDGALHYLNFVFLFHGNNLAMGAGLAISWDDDEPWIEVPDDWSKQNLNWRKWK